MAQMPTIRLVLLFNPASAGLRSMVDGILEAEVGVEFQVITIDLPGLGAVLSGSRGNADGWLIFAGSREVARKFARRQHRIPIVNLSAGLADNPLPSVWPDNREIGRLAAEHLAATGLNQFAFAGDADREHYGRLRMDGFRDAAGGRHCAVLEQMPRGVANAESWRKLRRKLVAWLKRLDKPCGILAADDQRAVMVSRACRHAGYRVPDDVAIVGVNNDEGLCAFGDPPLTSIELPWREIGREVAALMAHLVAGGERPRAPFVVRGSRLIERRSTQTVALDDPELAAAVRFIRGTAPHRPLSIGEVAEEAALSRSTLARRFRRHLGHPIGEEIARTRERRMRSLLLGTSMSVQQIAAEMSFRSVGELSRFCRTRTGRSPLALRAAAGNG